MEIAKTLHSAQEIPTSDMIIELASRGIDMTSAIEQRKEEKNEAVPLHDEARTLHKAEIIKFHQVK